MTPVELVQVDVFTQQPFAGNALAVFPDAAQLDGRQMQAIAREMNLSETTFVTSCRADRYEVRIFTPQEELGFAGHPTIGTAWTLRKLDLLQDSEVVQSSGVGDTVVRLEDRGASFEREGAAEQDLPDDAAHELAAALGVEHHVIGLEARELGRSGRLRPAYSNAGLRQLMVPLKDATALAACRPDHRLLQDVAGFGAYCFTATGAGRVRARGLFPGAGVAEDPGTGSAAAALGLFLADRLGSIDLHVEQGVEMGRRCEIDVRAADGRVRVGGDCAIVLRGTLGSLP